MIVCLIICCLFNYLTYGLFLIKVGSEFAFAGEFQQFSTLDSVRAKRGLQTRKTINSPGADTIIPFIYRGLLPNQCRDPNKT